MEQLELEIVSSKALALQVLQQLPESEAQRVCAVQPETFGTHFNLEVFILSHSTRLLDVLEINMNERRVKHNRKRE